MTESDPIIVVIDGDLLGSGRLASDEGLLAFQSGQPLNSCPYGPGSFCRLQWQRAWCRESYFSGALAKSQNSGGQSQ